ncbi:MAG: NusA-like transcription termination signal-binding factor [Candidatus Hadarchaeia archaeon]
MNIKLDNEKLRYLALFEELTGVTPKDCVESGDSGDKLTFVVDGTNMGKAIGQNGKNIGKVRRKLDKRVDVVEYSDDPEDFLGNIFSSVDVESIEVKEEDGEKVAYIGVHDSDKGRAVGKNGWNIERARKLSDRHHGISEVSFK